MALSGLTHLGNCAIYHCSPDGDGLGQRILRTAADGCAEPVGVWQPNLDARHASQGERGGDPLPSRPSAHCTQGGAHTSAAHIRQPH